MRNKFNILYVSPEVFPFTQTGALGEISGALPKYLKNFGHDIRVITPNYRCINERKYVLRDVIRLQGIKIKIGNQEFEATAKSSFIPDSKVQVYFLDNKHFFDREGLYFDPDTGKEFSDNAERFIFFCKGCLEILKLLHWQPNIIHCNDWQTAILPLLLKTVYRNETFFRNTRTLLSLHNPFKEGSFDASVASKLGVADLADVQKNGHFNFLKMGLEFADLLSISSVPFSKGVPEQFRESTLFESFKKRKSDLHSISNGVDDQVWNPERDDLIPKKYGRRDLSGKTVNKQELLNRFRLSYHENIPVLSVITRYPDDEVTELLPDAVEQLVRLELQMVIIGPAAAKHKKKFKALQKEQPDKIAYEPELDPALFHLTLAGSDLGLMPSGFESCGLNLLYSLSYGAIPIAYKQGMGAEFVVDIDANSGSGNGFVFDQLDPKELVKVIKTALKTYEKKEIWIKIVQNTMRQDLSWDASAQKYVKLYQKLLISKGANK